MFPRTSRRGGASHRARYRRNTRYLRSGGQIEYIRLSKVRRGRNKRAERLRRLTSGEAVERIRRTDLLRQSDRRLAIGLSIQRRLRGSDNHLRMRQLYGAIRTSETQRPHPIARGPTPPSTISSAPVTYDAASEARKMHGYAISSTRPKRRNARES